MSNADFREPTNDELWTQPPAVPAPNAGAQDLAPLPGPQLPAAAHPSPRQGVPQSLPVPAAKPDRSVLILAIVSTALAIPLTAIASGTAGLVGLLIVWVGIVMVNAVHAWSRSHTG